MKQVQLRNGRTDFCFPAAIMGWKSMFWFEEKKLAKK